MLNTEKSERAACTQPVLPEELIEALSLLGEVKRLVTMWVDKSDPADIEGIEFPQFEADCDSVAGFIGNEIQVKIHNQIYHKEA